MAGTFLTWSLLEVEVKVVLLLLVEPPLLLLMPPQPLAAEEGWPAVPP